MAYADHVVKIITIKSVIHYCFSAVKRKHNMHVGIFDNNLSLYSTNVFHGQHMNMIGIHNLQFFVTMNMFQVN